MRLVTAMRVFGFTGAVLACGGSACTQGGVTGGGRAQVSAGVPENKAAPVNAAANPAHPGLEGCAAGDVAGALAITADLEQSYHEMVVCGGLTASFTVAFVNLIIQAAFGEKTGADGYTFDGQGRYRTGAMGTAGTVMDLSLYLARDTSFGRAGDLITFDVFALANYFSKATFRASASYSTSGTTSTEIGVTFESPGPAAELIGVVPGTPSPIKLNFTDVVARLGLLAMKAEITVADKQRETNIRYVLRSPGTTVADALASHAISYQLVEMTATRQTSGQSVTVKTWDMNYQAGGRGTLDGRIAVDITGGAFPFATTFTYPHRRTPDVSLSCMAPAGQP